MRIITMIAAALCASLLPVLSACGTADAGSGSAGRDPGSEPQFEYTLSSSHEAESLDSSVCTDGNRIFLAGSGELTRYASDWSFVKRSGNLADQFTSKISTINDLEISGGILFASAEYRTSGQYRNLQIGIIDPDTLRITQSFPCDPESGLPGCGGIAADPDQETVWILPAHSESDGNHYLYRFSTDDGTFLEKISLSDPPANIRSLTFFDGVLYLTADDGDARKDEPDHLYRVDPETGGPFICEKTFDDIAAQGEIDGLAFDPKQKKLLVVVSREGEFTGGGDLYPEQEFFSDVYVYDLR